ncbi:pigment-dispersing hormone type 1 [Phlebotomus argentipes]|uniref:pigment-dispersing hormone type 1 n=1 Tax=Phlebotomus argentipes TaxID=94469 RepID=UPI002892F8C7|nr:pigment-dispersing hormone type 1 [Phlebotomus argentipes]
MPQNCAASARIFGLIAAWHLILGLALAMPAMDDDLYYDRQFSRDFTPWMAASLAYTRQPETPCQFYNLPGNYLTPPQIHKRNSELINSLLSLPKTMNDAGK